MSWPSGSVNTTNLDASTDNPGNARPDLLDAVQKLNVIISNGAPLTGAGGTLTASLFEAKTAMATANIDVSLGSMFTKTVGANTTFTVTNVPPSGTCCSFVLDITNGGAYTLTWWSGVKWPGGSAPTLTSSGRDVLVFFTHDGGTTWTGILCGRDVR